ncbi:hypothetical protein IQ07DRAFT_351753 [Pyrenochaeta sp. DS3sAY3a]|nr:hypothetical protein IQ07DRAFT_351753 [Pyrenochaeta sp. DS3sAY3a]
MPKNCTGTAHHCPGMKQPVAGIPAGNCRWDKVQGLRMCKIHQQPCPQGCGAWYCLKSETKCGICIGKEKAEEARRRAVAGARREEEKRIAEPDFFNPPKERKKIKGKREDANTNTAETTEADKATQAKEM